MFRAALVLWLPSPHAAFFTPPALCSRSVPSGQAMELVLPSFRRRVSHAGRDGRLDNERRTNAPNKTGSSRRDEISSNNIVMKLRPVSDPLATAPPFGTVEVDG